MPTPILMPALSPTMTEGNLAKWLKSEGDAVKSGDVIAEIETDKATMEVEAVDEGTLGKILVPEGTEGVAVNTPIARLGGNGASAAAPEQKPAEAKAPEEPRAIEAKAPAEAPAIETHGVSEEELKDIDKKVRDMVADSAEFAQNDREPDPSELWTDIYADDVPQAAE